MQEYPHLHLNACFYLFVVFLELIRGHHGNHKRSKARNLDFLQDSKTIQNMFLMDDNMHSTINNELPSHAKVAGQGYLAHLSWSSSLVTKNL